jgi:hypothetical protein
MTRAAYIAHLIRETRDHRPRRSQQTRSTRPRAESRAHLRTLGLSIPNERRSYILDRRSGRATLTGEAVYREYVNRRVERVRRAEADVAMSEKTVEALKRDAAYYQPIDGVQTRANGARIHEIRGWLVENKAALADAIWERDNAKRSAARPAGELVTVPVVSIHAAQQ